VQVPRLAIDGVGIGRIHQSACEEGVARQVEHVPVPPLAYKMIDFYDKAGNLGKKLTLLGSS